MPWKARLIEASEREQYDAFVASHPKGHILQSFAWGEVKAATGWHPLRLVVEEEGQMVAAVLLLERPIPFIRRSLFYAPRGPVLDLRHEALFAFLLAEIAGLARRRRAILLKLDPDVPAGETWLADYLRSCGFGPAQATAGFEGTQPRFVFRLDLTPGLDALFAAFHPKTRYNIRLASRRGVEIKENCTRDDLRVFYDLLLETAHRDRFLVRSYGYFEVLWRELVEHGLARLFLATYQGGVIAGTLAFILGDKAWYIYGASSNRYREVMPNYLLQWHMIRWARENGCTMYDFRGVPGDLSPDNPLYGLYRFKKGFAGEYTEFIGEYDLAYSPFYYWLWNVAEPLYYRGVRHLRRQGRGE
ncbi:MAG: peptidoglycan bridge formation glycyltransferase FemA/FemB family protein [Clostridia bacterium]|nr:MAG: peptidoglycan bridge formation glycyltransferase FemA/FemB family protein [Clostridia bacterium]